MPDIQRSAQEEIQAQLAEASEEAPQSEETEVAARGVSFLGKATREAPAGEAQTR